jgi:hypothetical protein
MSSHFNFQAINLLTGTFNKFVTCVGSIMNLQFPVNIFEMFFNCVDRDLVVKGDLLI